MGNQFALFLTQGATETAEQASDSGGLGIGIDGYFKYSLFGHDVYLTNTHVSILIVMIVIIGFAIAANIAIRRADPTKATGAFLNVIELIVEKVDGLTKANMGEGRYLKFSNYIGTLFIFLPFANLAGLFLLRPPTADYGVTLTLGLITFVMIQYNGIKYQKLGRLTGLFKPIPVLFPINLIGEFATPLSLSLRLFGNIMSGTVMMGLIYGLLPWFLTLIYPAFLHAYFDLFSGLIQTYVFCMLTMVFIAQTFEEE